MTLPRPTSTASTASPVSPDAAAGRPPTRRALLAAAALAGLGLPTTLRAQSPRPLPVLHAGQLAMRPVVEGLDHPWGLAPLPGAAPGEAFRGSFLVTERPGTMRIASLDGRLSAPLAGLPPVVARGQGGLLDVAVHPRFASNRLVYWTYAESEGGDLRRVGTALARGRLDPGGLRLEEVQVLFRQAPKVGTAHHFGSRLVWDRDGHLFMTLGDRGDFRPAAQQLDGHIGKVLRLTEDGQPAPGNPFLQQAGARPEIWSLGHRNVQGAALHPRTGMLWTHEHGPQGGDEVNIVQAGRNHGWPVVTQGREYVLGTRIGEAETRADVAPALRTWVPSIAPSGLAFVGGAGGPERYPGKTGQMVAGALRGQLLVRLELDPDAPPAAPRVLREIRHDTGARIRDVRAAPDGWLYLLTDAPETGRLLRVESL